MEVVRKKMLIKYWNDMYSIGHMALFTVVPKLSIVLWFHNFHSLFKPLESVSFPNRRCYHFCQNRLSNFPNLASKPIEVLD